jgi:phosphate:Na+ symporter
MTQAVLQFLGGVGLFLFGMEVMTAALRELASGGLRRLLAGFTATPLKGALTGAMATAVVQSSSAVTVMTIGFVGAGLIGFGQALGVLYGANIGTTITGWVVVLVGFKFKLGLVALPALFLASLMAMLGRGRVERAGRILAGFSLLFIGLEMMQGSMAGLSDRLSPEMLPATGWLGRIQLMGLGLIAALVMQSSSAGVALALVALGAGVIEFEHAAAMVIGMNLGTTFTGMLASLGGGRAMRMTALANVLFNLGTALLAFPLLSVVAPLLHGTFLGSDDQTALVLFHTGFNLFGALVFLPLTAQFSRLVSWMVPERRVALAAALEPSLLSDEGAAMDAAQLVADAITQTIYVALSDALGEKRDLRRLAALSARVEPAIADLSEYLVKIRVPADKIKAQERYASLLHQLDHLKRLMARSAQRAAIGALVSEPRMARPAWVLSEALLRGLPAQRLARLTALVDARARRHRHEALLHEHAGLISANELFQRTDAMRWLERVFDHAERIAHYRQTSVQKS